MLFVVAVVAIIALFIFIFIVKNSTTNGKTMANLGPTQKPKNVLPFKEGDFYNNLYLFCAGSLVILLVFVAAVFLGPQTVDYYRYMHHEPRAITLFSCSGADILMFALIVAGMTSFILILKLMLFAEMQNNTERCTPLLFLLGSGDACKQMIARNAKYSYLMQTAHQDIKKITFSEQFTDRSAPPHPSWFYETYAYLTEKFSHLFHSYARILSMPRKHMPTLRRHMYQEFVAPTLAKW